MLSERLHQWLSDHGSITHADLVLHFGNKDIRELKEMVDTGDAIKENLPRTSARGRPKASYKLAGQKHQMSKDDLLKNAYQINQDLQLALLCINQANKHLDAAFSAIMKAYPELAEDVQPVTKWS